MRRGLRAIVWGTPLLLLAVSPLLGQTSPPLPVDHWSRPVVHRLAGVGAVDGGNALSSWPLSRSALNSLLEEAASSDSPGAARLAQDALSRLVVEYPDLGGAPGVALRIGGGWEGSESSLRAGTSFLVDVEGSSYGGPVQVPDRDDAIGTLRGETSYGVVAGFAEVHRAGGRPSFYEGAVSAGLGPLDVWIGRRGLAMGPPSDASVVVSPGTRFDGGGVSLPSGFRLGALGQVRASASLARMERSGSVVRPFFSAARLTVTPRPGLVVGLNRAAIFGGEGNLESVTPWNVLLGLAGVTSYLGKDSGFENQVASVDVWMRRAVGGVPVALYGEWAIDDIGFAMVNAPAFLVGAEVPILPFWPAAGIGFEHVRFAGSCCGHPAWYRHRQLGEGWTDRGVDLGHPLGGHGTEWALRLGTLGQGGGLVVSSRLFARRRGEENLYSPDREGGSYGGSLEGGWRLGSVEVRGAGSIEAGPGWSTWTAEVGSRWWLRAGG